MVSCLSVGVLTETVTTACLWWFTWNVALERSRGLETVDQGQGHREAGVRINGRAVAHTMQLVPRLVGTFDGCIIH